MRSAWAVLAAGLALVAACGESEEPSGSGGKAGSDAGSGGSDNSSTTGGTGGASGADGSADSAGASYNGCGEERAGSTCQLAFTKCTTDPGGCKAIMDCVYGATPGCTLGEQGAPCVESCIQTHCTSAASAKLFLEAERCAYCEPACSALCSAYCSAFTVTPDTVTCPNILDAGPDGDAESDAPADAATDVSADADASDDAPADSAPDVSADSPAE